MKIITLKKTNPINSLYEQIERSIPLSNEFNLLTANLKKQSGILEFLENKIYLADNDQIDVAMFLYEKLSHKKTAPKNKYLTYYIKLRLENFRNPNATYQLQIPMQRIKPDTKKAALDQIISQIKISPLIAPSIYNTLISTSSEDIQINMLHYISVYPEKECIYLLKEFALHNNPIITKSAILALGYFKFPETNQILDDLIKTHHNSCAEITFALINSKQKICLGCPQIQ